MKLILASYWIKSTPYWRKLEVKQNAYWSTLANNQSPMMVTLLNILPAVVWETNSFIIFYLPTVAIMNLFPIYWFSYKVYHLLTYRSHSPHVPCLWIAKALKNEETETCRIEVNILLLLRCVRCELFLLTTESNRRVYHKLKWVTL